MTRNITLTIQLKFCATYGSQALMHLSVQSMVKTKSEPCVYTECVSMLHTCTYLKG